MDAANLIVGLVLGLQTPFFIIALISGLWASSRISQRRLGRKTKALAWTAFVTCLLVTVGYLGRMVLIVRLGDGGSALMSLFMTALWAFFSFQSYTVLRRIGAV